MTIHAYALPEQITDQQLDSMEKEATAMLAIAKTLRQLDEPIKRARVMRAIAVWGRE